MDASKNFQSWLPPCLDLVASFFILLSDKISKVHWLGLSRLLLGYSPGPSQYTPFFEICKSAEQGNACGQNELGTMYARGEGVPRDVKEAVKWYRKAAEQGYAHAQTNLGSVYDSGILKDDKEAVKWFRKAAEQGGDGGQNGLAFMYENGRGVEKDVVRAYAWHEIAAANGGGLAYLYKEDKSKLAKKMTPAQIAEAEELVKEMVKKNPKLLNKK